MSAELDALQPFPDERPPLEEHAEKVRAYALGIIGREPTTKETAEAVKQAEDLRAWIRLAWCGPDTRKDFWERLEARIYDVGLLSLWWGLSGDMAALCDFLDFMRQWQDTEAGHPSAVAMGKASQRESAEWNAVAQAIGNMEYQAIRLKSPRLAEAAKIMRTMLTPDRIRPEMPMQAGTKQNTDKGRNTRNSKRENTQKVMTERYQQGNYENAHAAAVELAGDGIEQARRDGWKMSQARAVKTHHEWFLEADKIPV